VFLEQFNLANDNFEPRPDNNWIIYQNWTSRTTDESLCAQVMMRQTSESMRGFFFIGPAGGGADKSLCASDTTKTLNLCGAYIES
jgi:hypothetical protein